jgi:hypothetical protein
MDLRFTNQLAVSQDVRHQVRHLGWFRRSFKRCVDVAAKDWGIDFTVHDERLAKSFLDWVNAFAEQRKYAELSRKDFANFGAGLLLKELIQNKVCTASDTSALNLPPEASARVVEIIKFWPEGFLYTSFCLSVLNAVMLQDFGSAVELKPMAEDLRVWWSFRENATEDASLAVAFLDAFIGNEPNWMQPNFALARRGMSPPQSSIGTDFSVFSAELASNS